MSRVSKLTNEQLSLAVAIFSDLSPENLTGDGELSRAQVQKRWKEIMKRLANLETQVGFHLDEVEVYREWDRRPKKRTSSFRLKELI